MEISVKLQAFEGPLDLLLHLIDENKVNIYDIPIAEITDQYIDYLHRMEETDLDVMSEFLVMAATLLDIKCRMLLPREISEEGEEIDPRAELAEQLMQYKMYKYISYELKERQTDADHYFFRKPFIPDEVAAYIPPVDMDELLDDLTLLKLHGIFNEVMRRSVEKIDPIRSKFGKIEREEVSMAEKVIYIEKYIGTHSHFSFRQLLAGQCSRNQVIVTFLAVLELIKRGKLRVCQDHTFADIQIEAA